MCHGRKEIIDSFWMGWVCTRVWSIVLEKIKGKKVAKSNKEQTLEVLEWIVYVGLSVVTSRGQENAPSL